MGTDKLAVRQKDLSQGQCPVRMSVGTFLVGAGVDTFNAPEQHMHPGREQHIALCVSRQRNDCQQNADRCQGILLCGAWEDAFCQLRQRNCGATALADHFIKRAVKDKMTVHPGIGILRAREWSGAVRKPCPELIQRRQTVLLGLLKFSRSTGQEAIDRNIVFHLPGNHFLLPCDETKIVRTVRRCQIHRKFLNGIRITPAAVRHTGCGQDELHPLP